MIYEAHNVRARLHPLLPSSSLMALPQDRMLSTDRTYPFLSYLLSDSAPAPMKPLPSINKMLKYYLSQVSIGGGAAREINEAAGFTAPAHALRGFHDQLAAMRAIEARAAGWLARGAAGETRVDMHDLRVRPYSEHASYDVLRFLQLSDTLAIMEADFEVGPAPPVLQTHPPLLRRVLICAHCPAACRTQNEQAAVARQAAKVYD